VATRWAEEDEEDDDDDEEEEEANPGPVAAPSSTTMAVGACDWAGEGLSEREGGPPAVPAPRERRLPPDMQEAQPRAPPVPGPATSIAHMWRSSSAGSARETRERPSPVVGGGAWALGLKPAKAAAVVGAVVDVVGATTASDREPREWPPPSRLRKEKPPKGRDDWAAVDPEAEADAEAVGATMGPPIPAPTTTPAAVDEDEDEDEAVVEDAEEEDDDDETVTPIATSWAAGPPTAGMAPAPALPGSPGAAEEEEDEEDEAEAEADDSPALADAAATAAAATAAAWASAAARMASAAALPASGAAIPSASAFSAAFCISRSLETWRQPRQQKSVLEGFVPQHTRA
jgi:hypothetical protein